MAFRWQLNWPKWSHNAVTIHESSGKRLSEISGVAVLGLAELPFVHPGLPHRSAFTMAISQGDKVTVSGTDPFNAVILPLVKAMDHATSLYKAESNLSPREASTPALMPWVRVRRQEAQPDRDRIKYMHYAVDLIHVDFFDEFIADHLTPFADEFVSRVKKQSTILFKSGTVANLDNWHWDKIKPYRN
jgi:hypothetical protein